MKPPAPPVPIDTRKPQQVTMDTIRADQAKERKQRPGFVRAEKAMLTRDQTRLATAGMLKLSRVANALEQ